MTNRLEGASHGYDLQHYRCAFDDELFACSVP